MSDRIKLFYHGGSGNHGCEAIVRATDKIIQTPEFEKMLFSFEPAQDKQYGLDSRYQIMHMMEYKADNPILRIARKARTLVDPAYSNIFNPELFARRAGDICLSIGGDNYSEYAYAKKMGKLNRLLRKNHQRTVLWGCSVEPALLAYPDIAADLRQYSLITARESITYHALLDAGIAANTKLYPDPAFQLDAVQTPLPEGFQPGNTVGLNISPLVIGKEKVPGVTLKNCEALLTHIIQTTDFRIALIPHVVWPGLDDRKPLGELYRRFAPTGRVALVQDAGCMALKGIIAQCRMFIGARTHATIAAYSSCVPTVVIGYSVKARGIAQDLFGTQENYVIPVQTLQKKDDLIRAFEWLRREEEGIRRHLETMMPDYRARALKAGEEIMRLPGETN